MSIYLDNNATTEAPEPVRAAMAEMLDTHWHNPSSVHRPGQAARHRVELARKRLAELIGARPRQVTICGSGTEAIDLAIRGALLAQGRLGGARKAEPGPGAIVTTRVEHVAIRDLVGALEREEGVRTLWADLDADGLVDLRSFRAMLGSSPDVALASVQMANNETGIVQPVQEIAAICRERNVLFHTDATQYVGKMPVVVEGAEVTRGRGAEGETGSARGRPGACLGVDLLTYSPHKFHGPKGVGVLYSRPGVRTAPLIHGEQEQGRRGGTENVAGIVGAGVAAELAMAWLADPANIERGRELRDRFEAAVLRAVPDAHVNGQNSARLWNTSSIGFPRLEAEALLLLLSERGVCASAGAACASGSLEPSPVLRALNIPPEIAHGTLRFSLARTTTWEELGAAVEIIAECVARLRQSMSDVR
ncbi:MAG TPA: cysteine desulfurase family protein [Phycisphaerales bacterium]|nr:cysteine desulfurase family protein [Phycisphaerales bacterium]